MWTSPTGERKVTHDADISSNLDEPKVEEPISSDDTKVNHQTGTTPNPGSLKRKVPRPARINPVEVEIPELRIGLLRWELSPANYSEPGITIWSKPEDSHVVVVIANAPDMWNHGPSWYKCLSV